jgi:hypothetical protein
MSRPTLPVVILCATMLISVATDSSSGRELWSVAGGDFMERELSHNHTAVFDLQVSWGDEVWHDDDTIEPYGGVEVVLRMGETSALIGDEAGINLILEDDLGNTLESEFLQLDGGQVVDAWTLDLAPELDGCGPEMACSTGFVVRVSHSGDADVTAELDASVRVVGYADVTQPSGLTIEVELSD